ncbi:MAG: pyridoxamine 5'-phosphate oxidase family protein [Flavisolibacter sp.]
MISNLAAEAIEQLLKNGVIGHLGCYGNDTVYVVPISYAYDGQYVYCHTHEGMKVQMMRKNPKVCFQIEEMKSMASWKSVIAWGQFEELENGAERKEAIQILLNRALPILSSITTHLGKEWPFTPNDIKDIKGIVFRIKIENKTGRFEQEIESPPISG